MAADAPPLSAKELDWLRDLHERAQRSVQGSHVRDEFLDSLQHRAEALFTLAERALAEPRKPASEDEINAASWNAVPSDQGLTWRQGFVAGATWAQRDAARAARAGEQEDK